MRTRHLLRSWHKWLGLLIGLQMLIWSVSGSYMVAVDIDFIHGDSLVHTEPRAIDHTTSILPIASLINEYGELQGAKLTAWPGSEQPVYELTTADGSILVDGVTGERLSPLSSDRIQQLARSYYAGRGEIARVEPIERVPVEIRGRAPGLWRVDFDDWLQTSFYLDATTGALVTRRHRLWRIFDTFWMLHIMDYGYERDDVNNTLLRISSAFGLVFGATGLWLLFYSFGRSKRARRSSP